MKILSNINTTRLVKGSTYDVLSMDTLSKYPVVTILVGNSIARFSASGFKNVDGSELDKKKWKSPDYDDSNKFISDVRLLKKGDVIICISATKHLLENKMYRVSDIFYKETERRYNYIPAGSSLPKTYIEKEQKIKIEGYNRWLSTYKFRFCNNKEKREISLGKIFGESVEIDVDFSMRKIDKIEKKKKNQIIINTIFNSIMDPNKNNLSSIEWAIQKTGKKFDITESDIKPFLNMKLTELIKVYENGF